MLTCRRQMHYAYVTMSGSRQNCIGLTKMHTLSTTCGVKQRDSRHTFGDRERVDRERWSDIEPCGPILRVASFFALLQCALLRKILPRNTIGWGRALPVPKTLYLWRWHW